MNEPARGPNRPMASGRRLPRAAPARQASADSATELESVQPRIPWSRRIGIVVALLALGGTVVLAGGFGGSNPGSSAGPSHSAGASPTSNASAVAVGPTPKSAPVLGAPSSTVTARKTWTAHVTVTSTGIARKNLQLRIYRNEAAILKVPVPRGATMSVPNIPLKSGVNAISAAFLSPAGEGPRSNVVTLTVDDQAPRISITDPTDHEVIDATSVTLTGTTDPDAKVLVTNVTASDSADTTADRDGNFNLAIALAEGGNDLQLTATDAVGNVGRAELTVVRGSGVASAQLTLSRTLFRLRQLPTTFDVTLLVIDAAGIAVDGASVTFSLSPPGVPTSTYQSTTVAGRAAWTSVTLAEGLQAGSGFVTARVTLENGSTIQGTTPFTVK